MVRIDSSDLEEENPKGSAQTDIAVGCSHSNVTTNVSGNVGLNAGLNS